MVIKSLCLIRVILLFQMRRQWTVTGCGCGRCYRRRGWLVPDSISIRSNANDCMVVVVIITVIIIINSNRIISIPSRNSSSRKRRSRRRSITVRRVLGFARMRLGRVVATGGRRCLGNGPQFGQQRRVVVQCHGWRARERILTHLNKGMNKGMSWFVLVLASVYCCGCCWFAVVVPQTKHTSVVVIRPTAWCVLPSLPWR